MSESKPPQRPTAKPPRKGRKRYVKAVGPRLNRLLVVVLGLFAITAVNAVYLASVTLAGVRYQNWFYLNMVLLHLILGVVMVVPVIVFGLIGVGVMVAVANVDYGTEMALDAKAKPAEDGAQQLMPPEEMAKQMKKAIGTKATGVVWTCLVLYLAVAGCGAFNVALAGAVRSQQTRRRVRPASAAASPEALAALDQQADPPPPPPSRPQQAARPGRTGRPPRPHRRHLPRTPG